MKKNEVLEIIGKCIPTSWLHPSVEFLLNKKGNYTQEDIEQLCLKVKKDLVKGIKDYKK